jgi:hypothetical protein
MWQLDGHDTEYPAAGGNPQHRRNDIMYPWTGGAAGYGTNASISSSIPMPNLAALGAKRNVDTLDYRTAFGYAYDTLAIIGIGLDRTGSMGGLTPDPMVTGAPDVTKWEAAKRGVSAFLQDCETVQNSGSTYVVAGIKTFRKLGANDFAPVFPSPNYGLVKTGGSYSRAAFDSAAAAMSPGGSTPLADALQDVETTLVEAPFGHLPPDERRYLAMLTDGLLTDGAPMSSIADGSFANTVVFAMGFGTGADVDYGTLASMVAKGVTLSTTQVFHGENAGTIDKFYSDALAHAIGFTGVIDPVLELFAGEFAHIEFQATSADDAFLITVQGMDYDDDNWTVHLHGPGGHTAHGHMGGHIHAHSHFECVPDVTVTRANGRHCLVIQRDNADDGCWIGSWSLMVAYKARQLDAMLMPTIGELIFPVAAGPSRGRRYSRLLIDPAKRIATRNVRGRPAHRLDVQGLSNNLNDQTACNAVVNIYARTRLQLELVPRIDKLELGAAFAIDVRPTVLQGNITATRALARLVAPTQDLRAAVAKVPRSQITKAVRLEGSKALSFDPAKLLAVLEKRDAKLTRVRDIELKVHMHEEARLRVEVDETPVPGGYHVGVYVEGYYCGEHENPMPDEHFHDHAGGHDHHAGDVSTCTTDCVLEPFSRVLTTTVVVPGAARATRRRRK